MYFDQENPVWFDLFGFIGKQDSAPHFVDLIFREVLPSWQINKEQRYFVQRVNNSDIIEEFVEIDVQNYVVIQFPAHFEAPCLKVGIEANYGIRLSSTVDFNNFPIISGFRSACEEILDEKNISFTQANPFFGLAVAQAINNEDLEVDFAELSFKILWGTDALFAERWIAERTLSDRARGAVQSIIGCGTANGNQFEVSNPKNHLRVAIVETVVHRSLSNRYFWVGEYLISFHICDVGLLFGDRTTEFDAVVAPMANYYNGEDLTGITRIAIVPLSRNKRHLQSSSSEKFEAVLVGSSPDLAGLIIEAVLMGAKKK